MKKPTLTLTIMLFVISQYVLSQEKFSRIKITNPTEQTIHSVLSHGVELSCGTKHEGEDLILELSETEISNLQASNISFTVLIDNLSKFYAEDETYQPELHARNGESTVLSRSSVSSVIKDNIIQYTGANEIDFATPANFPDVNSLQMKGCLTLSQMESQLDAMRNYSQTNGLNIVSVKTDASSTGEKTWGNPNNNFNNPKSYGPSTYSGTGSTRWNPLTIWYVRITGNESTTPEGTKPQMLFTSMIHSREVSALMNNIYFMWYIIENYNTDPAIKELVDNNELYFVPVVNPDGLRYNEVTNPSGGGMQRKNLRPYNGTTNPSRGVDLNRNFNYYWNLNNVGSSGITTNGTYRGPSPESEPETKIMVDFIENRNFKSAVWNHSYANSVPHPYGGDPNANTNREDEYYRWHEEMTRYNRYLYGATIFYESNGLPDDWMMGGAPDNNGATGLNQGGIIATTPEHGSEGFWPSRSSIIPIAKRSMRISLATAYYGGKYAKIHDLTQSNITSTSNVPLDFGIERIGQTQSGFTVNVTPISSNILNITSPSTVTGIGINTTPVANTFRNQTEVTAVMNLDPSIGDNEKIEYKVQFSNDDGIIYEANYVKYYQPTVLFSSTPDNDGLAGWSQSGGWATTTADAYSNSTSIYTGSYSNNANKSLTTTNSFDFSNSNEMVIQFYTKWDIERNYDFVEVLASPDGGSNWVSLNGKYTKPNATSGTTSHDNKNSSYANFQANSSGQIYDGDRMDNWVMEEITIDDNYASILASNNVRIRFNFRTDALNVNESYTTTNDGFFIDDFKIISLTIPCETNVPTALATSNITATSTDVNWDNIPSATYDVRYRATSSSIWTEVTDLSSVNYAITGLEPTTDYEVQVRTRCASATSAYSASVNFTTTDLSYCAAAGGNISDEYIGGVTLNGVENDTSSSTSSGYSDFTNSDIFNPIQIGSTNSITVTKYWNNVYDEAVSVWIDFNKNGTFEASEKIVSDSANRNATVTRSFTVPSNANIGITRMRVLMKYYDTAGTTQNNPCESFDYGEVEDYRVYLYEGLLYTNNTWYPNAPNASTGSENVLIRDGVYSANANIAMNNITINNGAQININKANAITVNGTITNNGEFILNSDSNEFSSLMVDGAVSGSITYNRYANTNAGGNDLIAPPVSGQTFVDFLSNNNNVYSNTAQTLYLFGPFEKPTNEYALFANTNTTTLQAGMGYRVASTDNGTFTFTGDVNTGNVDVPIVKTGADYDKWNLIGNPYPTYISLADFLAENISELDTFSAGVYGYDADDSNGSKWTIWNLAYSNENPGALIAPGQGFFVSSKTGGATISFKPSMRAIGTSDDFIAGRNSNASGHSILRLSSSNQMFDTELYFNDNTTLGLDVGYDAEHFGGAPSNFSIYSELVENNQGKDMAIQAISHNDIDNATVIPLGVNAAQGQQLVISLESANVSQDIYLEDVVANTFTHLNTSNYTFTANTDLTDTGRFYLKFGQQVLHTDTSELDRLQVYSNLDLQQIIIRGLLTQDTKVTVYDIQGRTMFSKQLALNSVVNSISTLQFTSGVYLVHLNDGRKQLTKKIVIK